MLYIIQNRIRCINIVPQGVLWLILKQIFLRTTPELSRKYLPAIMLSTTRTIKNSILPLKLVLILSSERTQQPISCKQLGHLLLQSGMSHPHTSHLIVLHAMATQNTPSTTTLKVAQTKELVLHLCDLDISVLSPTKLTEATLH